MPKERSGFHSNEATPLQHFDTAVVLGNTVNSSGQDPSLDQSTRNAMWAARLLKDAGFAKDVAAISSETGIELLDNYSSEVGIEDPIIKIQADEEERAKELIRIIEEGKLGKVALITPEDSSDAIFEELKHHGLKAQTITPDQSMGRRILDSTTLANWARFAKDVVRFGGLKNLRLSGLSLSHAHR